MSTRHSAVWHTLCCLSHKTIKTSNTNCHYFFVHRYRPSVINNGFRTGYKIIIHPDINITYCCNFITSLISTLNHINNTTWFRSTFHQAIPILLRSILVCGICSGVVGLEGGSIPDGVTGICRLNPSGRTMSLGPTQPLTFTSFHLAVCLTTGPKPLPKRALHIVRSRASSFK